VEPFIPVGELFYKEELEPYKKRGQYLMNLRYLTRQHESLTDMYVQSKLQFQAVLDQVFSEYHGVFGDLYSKVSLRFPALYPTSKTVLAIPGIGTKIAATILAEIGEIDRFDHAKKLVAFSGIDPSVFSSGKFTATRNKITKRGSSRLYIIFPEFVNRFFIQYFKIEGCRHLLVGWPSSGDY
jgi:hypothetical protein